MTMPHLMNCGHSDTGWCLDCVKAQWEELDNLKMRNEAWHRRVEQLNRDIDELLERAEIADERLDKKCLECVNLQTAINNALELVNKDCPSMDKFVNIVPTVAWLLQKWRECRVRWQDAVAKVAVADDDHHAMMNGPRIAQALGLNPSDTPRSRTMKESDAIAVATKALGWYAGMLRPEDRLNDNGDRATAALIVIMEKLK